jgi:integrase/recombinase XerD
VAEQHITASIITYVRAKKQRGDWYGRTPKVYGRHLMLFAASLPPSVAADPSKTQRKHVQAWIDRDASHSPAYMRVQLSAVRGFYRWMQVERRISHDPTLGVTTPPVPEGLARNFTLAERDVLIEVAGRDPRDLLCCSLAFYDAHRRGEIAAADVADVDLARGVIAVHGKGYRGAVSRRVPFSATTRRALGLYLAADPHSSGPLIRSRVDGSRLSPQRIGEIIGNVIRDAGLKIAPWDGRSSHAGRHTVGAELVEAGIPDRVGMKFVGHKSHANWMRYSNGAVADLLVVHDIRGESELDLR